MRSESGSCARQQPEAGGPCPSRSDAAMALASSNAFPCSLCLLSLLALWHRGGRCSGGCHARETCQRKH
eukprot:95463-Rhodomonas_salina.2